MKRLGCLLLVLSGALPLAGLAEDAPPIIPLCPGLNIVTAINQTSGDYESIKRIMTVGAAGFTLHYSSEHEVIDPFSDKPPELVSTNVTRRVLREDQQKAGYYLAVFSETLPEAVPNSTAISLTTDNYQRLKKTGKAELAIVTSLNDSATPQNVLDPDSPYRWWAAPSVYALELADKTPVKTPVLLNGKPAELPALHVKATFGTEQGEFFILDDPLNPLVLKFRLGIGHNNTIQEQILDDPALAQDKELLGILQHSLAAEERDKLQVTQINFDCTPAGDLPYRPGSGQPLELSGDLDTDAEPFPNGSGSAGSGGSGSSGSGGSGSSDSAGALGGGLGNLNLGAGSGEKTAQLEKALQEGEKVDIYDIFFSFNSATLRPESDETLQRIAALLTKHSDWKLAIGGHTDSIASDAFNLDLSNRRAAAVKTALVERYKIAEIRLSTQGYGESSPRDTNDTLEGRARNRRVELMRQP